MTNPFRQRLKNLRAQLESRGMNALLVTHLANVRYLCGFTGSAGALLVTASGAVLVTDGRYRAQCRLEVREARTRILRGDPLAGVCSLLEGRRKTRVGYEAERVPVAALKRLTKALRGQTALVGTAGLVEGLRVSKDAGEIATLRAAAHLASGLFRELLPLIRPGISELDLAAELEYKLKRAGAEGPSFETIVAFGERTALPHARPTTRRLRKSELVLLDWGAILRGYCSDLTRTVYLGRAPKRVRELYRAVQQAQHAAIEKVLVGETGDAVDRAARRVLEKARLGRFFTHSTGHGLGLEVHEEPRLARGQEARLQAGNVVTVEPGVYLEGRGGIRIEDDVLVTENGPEVLTIAPRELIQL